MRLLKLAVVLLIAGIVSCAPFFGPPDTLYRQLNESFADYDASVLIDRVVVIDPGHGGRFDGALGPGRTREADVNMGVATELARMLEQCGARVILTRTGDRDLLSPTEPDDLRKELEERVRVSNALEADLFISIHHNSSASRERDYNAIETYYRMGDDGPSLDASRYIHKHLVRNLGIPRNELVSGNYHVLRNNENPSILGEASYLSNPGVEKKIREHESQLLEARAYLLGIIDYFSHGVPDVRVLRPPPGATVYDAFPAFEASLEPGEGGGGIEVSTIRVTLDDRRPEWKYDPERGLLAVALDEPLAPGAHTLTISCRNWMGNSSRRTVTRFETRTQPVTIVTRTGPERIHAGSNTPFFLEARILDSYGNPVADGTHVSIVTPAGLRGEKNTSVRDGRAVFYLTAERAGSFTCTVRAGPAEGSTRITAYDDVLLPLAVKFIDGSIGTPLSGVKLDLDGEQFLVSNADGYVFSSSLPRGEHRVRASKPGYRPYAGVVNTDDRGRDSGLRVLLMDPVHQGVLMGRSVVVDPEGGGRELGATGPSGTRSIDLNLRVAQALAAYLEEAGASVHLTRDGDESVTSYQRVELANRVGADFFISVRHDAVAEPDRRPYLAYYGTSEYGKSLVREIALEWTAVLGEEPIMREEYRYILQHTPCPAIVVMSRDIGTAEREESTYRAHYGIREAHATYTGLVRFLLGAEAASLGEIEGQVQAPFRKEAPPVVELDGWLRTSCDSGGRFTLRLVEPGEHLLAITSPPELRNEWWVDTRELGRSPLILTP